LNFAPIPIKLPKDVGVRHVDFVLELAVLSYHLSEELEPVSLQEGCEQ
jgi:NADH/NAD ratio-sensing transcriptional regulator Rex